MKSDKFYDDKIKLDYSDVLVVPRMTNENSFLQSRHKKNNVNEGYFPISSRKDVSLFRTLSDHENSPRSSDNNHLATSDKWRKADHPKEWIFWSTPLIAANMDGVGTPQMGQALTRHGILTALVKNISDEELDTIQAPEDFFFTIGISLNDLDRLESRADQFNKVCIDTPNGYLESFYQTIEKAREICGPSTFIMAGNVVTPDAAVRALAAGADCVKVGIGPGSVCTTRLKTGVGFPQLSVVMEVREAIDQYNNYNRDGRKGFLCADGGCTNPGDIVKAFVGGADLVMLGGMLAGHDEGGGEGVVKYVDTGEKIQDQNGAWVPVLDEKRYVKFYGMSSKKANDKHNGGLKDYKAAEGKEVLVEYKGPVENTIQDILGGIRSACTYLNAKSVGKLHTNGKFVRVQNQNNKIFRDEI